MQADFSEIYHEYSKRLYLFIYGKCRNRETAEDALQTTFLKAIMNIDSFRGECAMYTWLSRIALNTLYSETKLANNNNSSLDVLSETNPDIFISDDTDPLQSIIDKENTDELYRRIALLNEDQQKIVKMRLNDIPFKKIGESLGKNTAWAKMNYYRAVEKLKRLGE